MAATGSPWKRTRSSASTGWVASTAPAVASAMRPGNSIRSAFCGTSAWVSTATTPGIARASLVSILTMRAEAYGLRTILAWSMPATARSPA